MEWQARHGTVRRGEVSRGTDWQVWRGVAGFGRVWAGAEGIGVAGRAWFGEVRCGMVWKGTAGKEKREVGRQWRGEVTVSVDRCLR
jgi:hypothetical protein